MNVGWPMGSPAITSPPEAGFALGADEETTYFMIQVHHHNPTSISNRLDSSGFRAYHTSKLRPYEAFSLAAGSVIDYGFFIPPNQQSFTVAGHCSTDCFKNV